MKGGKRGRKASPDHLHDALADFGDAELVLAGLHENVHRARFLDTGFRRAAGVLQTLGDADILQRAVHRRADFALLKYAPSAALRIHAVVAAPERCADPEVKPRTMLRPCSTPACNSDGYVLLFQDVDSIQTRC